MIAFLSRAFSIFFILIGAAFGLLFAIWGEPNEKVWEPLWQQDYDNIPLGGIILISLFALSFFIASWISMTARAREAQATRFVKELIEPDFVLPKKHALPKPLKKALVQTSELIDTQRKSLQRLSNERAEANDKVIQERIIAERQRLARELHDSVSQQLFAASMLLSALTESDENAKSLKQVEKIVQQAQLEMRALLLHLRPVALHNKTLAQGLEELIIELQQKVYFHIEYELEEIALTKAEEDHLFRIAQEALSNTLRHSKATEVELLLVARDNLAILRIQDNGLGFDVEADKSTSYGLQNIAERAVEIGCRYKIVSVPGEGTIVEVKVPLQKEVVEVDSSINSG
ncbi:sensor histidine kinase [Lysinibacillus sphaericus]|uniref:Sensor histidine kinase n=2 Tax=Lysinibacillus TaxID=400634 RepID=A0ABY2T4J3_9BACI|nr:MULTISPECIES: sensor histidine kinase [Lysinibacillus]AHN21075.1 histidine kinase [Lysinibacillus varians]TKI48199.1 sensor histidine kinase [Lysinibacillus tabacifolii]TKI51692.1 sensor histidine kinase [Lysinibacillus varians]UDK96001.1 sensor histidine kinase [Lysinibacillus sphaericus]